MRWWRYNSNMILRIEFVLQLFVVHASIKLGSWWSMIAFRGNDLSRINRATSRWTEQSLTRVAGLISTHVKSSRLLRPTSTSQLVESLIKVFETLSLQSISNVKSMVVFLLNTLSGSAWFILRIEFAYIQTKILSS